MRETAVLDTALNSIRVLLPPKWTLSMEQEPPLAGTVRFDALAELVGPNGSAARFVVECKRSGHLSSRHLIPVLRDIERSSGRPLLYVSDYIGATLREKLAREGISFADATGWVRVTYTDPLVLLTGQGADRSPRPAGSSAVIRFNGRAGSRLLRALATCRLPIGVRELADEADVSPGSASKYLATLGAEGIVDREDGRVVTVNRRALVRRWVQDYRFFETNKGVEWFIAPRGLDRALDRLENHVGMVVTGSAAARRLLPEGKTSVVPLKLLAIYAHDPNELAKDLGLIPAAADIANVVIAHPQDPDILPNADAQRTAPAPLVLADLLTLPGRSEAEADQLMDALAESDERWKK